MCYKKKNLLYSIKLDYDSLSKDRLGPLTRHHRRPRSHGGMHEGENISFVPDKLHAAWHLLFANNSVNRIAEIMNDHWVDPDYFMVAVPKEFLETIYKTLKNEKT